jgi:hypothetical protein
MTPQSAVTTIFATEAPVPKQGLAPPRTSERTHSSSFDQLLSNVLQDVDRSRDHRFLNQSILRATARRQKQRYFSHPKGLRPGAVKADPAAAGLRSRSPQASALRLCSSPLRCILPLRSKDRRFPSGCSACDLASPLPPPRGSRVVYRKQPHPPPRRTR